MCTNDYEEISEAMCDAERIEAAHRRVSKKSTGQGARSTYRVPMEIGNVNFKSLTPAEKQQCMKEGRCFRCRQKDHTFRNCPKGQRS